MQTIITIAVIAIILAIIFLFIYLWILLNESCAEKFGYKPLNGGTLTSMAIAMTLIWVGFFMLANHIGNTDYLMYVEKYDPEGLYVNRDYYDNYHRNKIYSLENFKSELHTWSFWESTGGNALVLLVIGVLLSFFTFLRISFKSSILRAIASMFFLFLIGSLSFLALVIAVLIALCIFEDRNKKIIVVG